MRGSYNYLDTEGRIQTVHYIADALGFRVAATNLPAAPQGPNSIEKKIGLKNHLSFGLRFLTLRKCSKMDSLDMSQNQNGISSRFSSQNSSQNLLY